MAKILLQKYEYHVPFYRQIREFHHLCLKIPENTLHGWFKPACELLKPLYDELKMQVLAVDYIQVDETTLPVIINKQSHKAVREYLGMVRAVTTGLVFFHYDDGSRSQETARNLLEPFKGYLQSDGYAAYNIFEGKEGVFPVGCHAHIRRHYETAKEEISLRLNTFWLAKIQELYRIEQAVDIQGISPEMRMSKGRNRLFLFLTSWRNGWKLPIRKCFLKAGWDKPSPMPISFGHAREITSKTAGSKLIIIWLKMQSAQ